MGRIRPWETRAPLALCAVAALLAGCPGDDDPDQTPSTGAETVGDPTEGTTEVTPTTGADDGGPAPMDGVGIMGVRRLTREEYDNTVRDLLGDATRSGAKLLPEDPVDPFDNDFTVQIASRPLIDALEALATDLAKATVADPARKAMVLGCQPTGPDDAKCLTSFIESFGRRALRRPLEPAEIDRFAALAQLFIDQSGSFDEGVEVVLRAFLQDAEFVYRVERGAPTDTDGVFRLNDWEVATRLSYFLWGTTPDDALLDRAADGLLGTPEDIRAAAEQMLGDPRALDRVDRFHSMWLGYYSLPHAPELTAAMRVESKLLLEQVVFSDKTSWLDVFTATGSYMNDLLAANYGLPAPGSAEHVWVPYPPESGRQGILSHGSFLSIGAKFDDTSPTIRGKFVRTNLMCQVIPPPPPGVDVDSPPTSPDSNCKTDRYAAHREVGSCAGCHNLLDPIGFGLENFDQRGGFRTADVGEPTCTISGDGAVDGAAFNGPGGLADMLIETEVLDSCAVTQLYRLAMGHREQIHDMPYISTLQQYFRDNDHRFDQLLLALVSDEAFMFRREE